MKRLLKLQFRNIFHNKLFYVCLGISILTTTVVSLVTEFAFKNGTASTVCGEIMSLFTSEVGIINLLFITLFCTFDFTEGTAKNIVARGYNKTKVLVSKYIACFVALFIMYGIISILDFALFIRNGFGFQSSMIPLLIFCVFKILAFTILYGTIAYSLEKNSTAIIANLFVPNLVMLLLGIADSNLHTKMSQYWIDNIGNKFVENPTFGGLFGPIVMFLIYIALCFFIGSKIAKNKEVK